MTPPLFQLLAPRGLPPAGVDWARLASTAAAHGLAGVALAEARRAGRPFPAAEEARLQHQSQAVAAQALRASLLLGRLHRAFSAAGLVPVVLKGPPLAARCWPEPLLRPSVDVDLLLEPGALPRARALLAELGLAASAEADHHEVFQGPAGMVELHHQLLSGLGATLDWTDLQPVQEGAWEGRAVRLLSPEDELVYLSVHAANHLFRRCSWLYDLKLLLDARGAWDWGRVVALGEKTGFAVPLWAGLDAAQRCFGARVDAAALGQLSPPGPLRRLLTEAFTLERLERSAWAESQLRAGALRAAMAATPRNAARYAWGRLGRATGGWGMG
jgi:hypothetical protein